MAPRNVSSHVISQWHGLNSFISPTNIDEQSWTDSNNVLVNGRGEAEVLRSPKKFGDTVPGSHNSINSMDEFRIDGGGNALIIDASPKTYYLLAAGGTPVQIAGIPDSITNWVSLSVKNTFQRVNGSQFIQVLSDLTTVVRNGIDPPASAPTISYVANGADTTVIASSLQGSYCYYNSTTGHVSQPSDLSNILGPKAAGFDVRFAVTASAQPGVDKIIFFLTVDGGEIPYLVIDISSGDPHSVANATANYDIVQSDVSRDTLTPEPIYNSVPLIPVNAVGFIFEYKNRIFSIVDGKLYYSGFESCYIGNPHESWPFLNQYELLNDEAVGGIGTQSGALIFGRRDCHLLTGNPTDKVSSPNNVIAITEHIEPLKWNLGIFDPRTAVATNFGVIWVDQNKRIRLWNQHGLPSEIGQPFRTELDGFLGDTMFARWFQHGKNGGYYVVSDGLTVLYLMIYLSPTTGQMQFGYGKSSYLNVSGSFAEAFAVVTFNKVERFFISRVEHNTTNANIYEILNPSQAGDGWPVGMEIFFQMVLGGIDNLNFSQIHSVNVNGGLDTLELSHDRLVVSEDEIIQDHPEKIFLSEDLEGDTGGTKYGIVDSPERAFHVLKFKFGLDDRTYRNISGFTINVKKLGRLI